MLLLRYGDLLTFSTTVFKTVRPMLSDRCLSVCLFRLSCLSVCNVGVLWPNGWMDQDETWHLGHGHIVFTQMSLPQTGTAPNF